MVIPLPLFELIAQPFSARELADAAVRGNNRTD
jgi:hypothetical protein